MIERSQILINGDWVDSAGDGTLAVINPSTEQIHATVPRGSATDVDLAAKAAAAAFPSWSQSPIEKRREHLDRLVDILERRAEEITDTIVREVGQPRHLAVAGQTETAIADLRSAARALDEIIWDEQVGHTTVHRTAAGVVGAITPWNGPMKMVCMKAGAAIAAGCTVVVKGTEIAPISSFLFAEAVTEAGFPRGVFNLVSGTGPEVGEALVLHPLIDMISLTGSVRAGRRVMELASQSIKRVALELGGKSANIILEDADLQTALEVGIEDAFRNSGQVCGGLTRVLVPKSRLRDAEAFAADVASRYVLGDPFDPSTTLGPVTGAAARDRVRGYIQAGLDEGARLIIGGAEAPAGLDRGFFVKPTVFSAVNNMRIAREEIFGPVITLIPFDDDEDAVRLANDSSYGLAAAVWAGSDERARDVAKRVRAGRIRINGSPVNYRAPHGGFKLSGIGREGGRYGVEEFLEYQAVG